MTAGDAAPVADAAVALIEVAAPAAVVLLVRRAERAGDPWSGQWGFPGGRTAAIDRDPLATCLREVREEVGLALVRTACAAALPLETAGRHLAKPVRVAPFLFRLALAPALVPDPAEVAAVRWLPLDWLREPARHARGTVFGQADQPYADLDGVPLWGLTYRLLVRHVGLG